ncbi:hypothetical protein C8N25_11336 [Algoriphagus antarcticus]|uniref:Uncharacterized protein n=1 Tax=Algoriphagus antarcticus TaxID=238540 RepID=A0A3E0DUK3_9BACT|nr:hypothetical protein C8N25_11336 [Algoriphagus antarcticus]
MKALSFNKLYLRTLKNEPISNPNSSSTLTFLYEDQSF